MIVTPLARLRAFGRLLRYPPEHPVVAAGAYERGVPLFRAAAPRPRRRAPEPAGVARG